jgi:hypothetical protein
MLGSEKNQWPRGADTFRVMIAGRQEARLEKETGWGISVAIALAVFSFYMYSTKPACREGFTPLMRFGSVVFLRDQFA